MIQPFEIFSELIEVKALEEKFNYQKKTQISGLCGSSFAFILCDLFKRNQRTFLVVLSDKEDSAYLFNELQSLLKSNQTHYFPESSKHPYQSEETINTSVQERAELLNLLGKNLGKRIIITTAKAISEKVVSKFTLAKNTLEVKVGEKISVDFISEFLIENNFNRVDFVFDPGQFSIRGGIVDVYSFSSEKPYRLEFFGDEIESIRSFDTETQLSLKNYNFITLIPDITNEQMIESAQPLTAYLHEDSIIWLDDEERILYQCETNFYKAEKDYALLKETIQKEPEVLFLKSETAKKEFSKFCSFEFNKTSSETNESIKFNQSVQPSFNKNFELLFQNLVENKKSGYKNYFLTESVKQAERIQSIFQDLGLIKKYQGDVTTLFEPAWLNIHEGFIDHELKIAAYTDHQIFERYHKYNLRSGASKSKETLTLKEIQNLNPGDFVTHIDHGIGRFAGLEKMIVNGREQEAIRLIYKDNDVLLVSIHALHRVSKYSGKEGNVPRIDKLGSIHWQTLKNKTKKKVKEIAFDLIKLYAKRKSLDGHAFAPDNYLQNELEASFIYEDTPDQEKSTADVKRDMEKSYPMDRLVCGDVGFGKTEVAIRAAFKAVCDSKQVAVLVPTTILALQHFKTFSERLKGMPCKVDYLNRFKSAKDQKETLKKLSEGKVDIIIGTHKLAGKEVKFNDLGLLIIDEEQKFGVAIKDKLKTLKETVDTLTLTATPIPRTLQFSLMGARDLSVIATPPPNRYPIQTELLAFNEEQIRDAIHFELKRGGQVFFVHNKVQSLPEIAGMINRLVPEARVAMGHGQMEGEKLENIMLAFIDGYYDVLVCTTIVESGLDIPNANTIIINDAQNFGLSDLHQMRGRVGRSNKKAFCYLFVPSTLILTNDARKRLKAITEFTDLGSGFNIAMKDLDIRGAGNLLGGEQSGFINDMGFETYMKILGEAMDELREEDWYKESVKDDDQNKGVFSKSFVKETTLETDFELLIPNDYVQSITERLNLYRDLDDIRKEKDLMQFENNLRDRFGPIPKTVGELINVVRLRWQAMDTGFEKIILKNRKMILHFLSKPDSPYFSSPKFQAVMTYIQMHPDYCNLKESGGKLSLVIERIENIANAMHVFELINQQLNKNAKKA
ncbi:MAG: transcription-repair coupling factor [Bacteroidota bacterium]